MTNEKPKQTGVVILICLGLWVILKIVERKNASSESDK